MSKSPDIHHLEELVAERTAELRAEVAKYKQAEQEKQVLYENFQTLIDSMDALVYVADMDTYELILVNKFGREIWGDIEGKICWQTLQKDQDGPCEFCTNARLIDFDGQASGEYVWEFQNTVNQCWYECRDQAIKWGDGRLVRMEIATDITARKQAEASKKKLEIQLRQAQKMEAIGTLAGGIAHDFNNILVPILAYTEMVMEQLPCDSTQHHDLHEVLTAANRAKSLVKQILTFSRQKEHEYKPLLVSPIVKESIKLIKASLPSTISIRQYIRNRSDIILGDPTQLYQVIMNLCTNAFQAMEEKGGTLEISLEETDAAQLSTSRSLDDSENYLLLTVRDSGCGMDTTTQARVFEPYFTTKGRSGGTGLGLATVHAIVHQFGGEITFTSEPGQGSTFKVYLPLAMSNTGDKPPAPAAAKGDEHILLVDDEACIVSSIGRILQNLGYQVTTCTNGLDALKLFRVEPDSYDMLISDQTMPGLTGDQLALEVMNLRPDMPIILCTGYSTVMDKERALALGIKAFVMKPIIKNDIAATIRQIFDKKEV